MPNEPVFHHFRPDLIEALVDAIARLHKGKEAVLTFFKGAGVPSALLSPEAEQIRADKNSISKFAIARNVLVRLNDEGDRADAVRMRREVVRRVSEWENFDTCWPADKLAAQGAVREVCRLVNVRDSFTRMEQERESEAAKNRRAREAENLAEQQRREEFEAIKRDFYALFGQTTNPQGRGKALEGVMNRLFKHAGIGIREAFTVTMDETGKPLEQIDGVIEVDHRTYLVEMKWEQGKTDVPRINNHLSRVFMRKNSGDIRGMYISYAGYTEQAVQTVKRAKIAGAFCFLITVRDLFELMESRADLLTFCRTRITAADVDERPLL